MNACRMAEGRRHSILEFAPLDSRCPKSKAEYRWRVPIRMECRQVAAEKQGNGVVLSLRRVTGSTIDTISFSIEKDLRFCGPCSHSTWLFASSFLTTKYGADTREPSSVLAILKL